MKSNAILILALGLSLSFGCNESKGQKSQQGNDTETSNGNETKQSEKSNNAGTGLSGIAQLQKSSMKGIEKTKYHEFKDPKTGMVQYRFPIPTSWKVNSSDNPIFIEGSNNLKIHKAQTNTYHWSNDAMMQQNIQMTGQTLAQPLSNQQILEQYVKPNAESQGYKFLKSADFPEISGLYRKLFNAMPNIGTQQQVEAIGTEWTTNNGTKSFIVLIRTQFIKQNILTWMIQTSELETSPEDYDEAKQAYVYSIANTQLNPQWIQHMNGEMTRTMQNNDRYWAQVAQQSAAAHSQRMQAIAAAGNASRSMAETYSEIADISHQGYLNRSNINQEGHSKLIRAINETTIIGNHETGEHYNVPSGSNYYWVSNQGAYIGTDNSLFDPNVDDRTNSDNWTKFAQEQ